MEAQDVPLLQPGAIVSNYSQRLRSLLFDVSLPLAMAAAAGVTGCNPASNKNVSSGPDSTKGGGAGSDTTHTLQADLASFCARQAWTDVCTVPEFTDDQRLSNGGSSHEEYGPVVKTIPADGLETRINSASFASIGAAVAAIRVDTIGPPTSLPQTYRNLELEPGINCVYLGYTLSTNSWRGYLTRAGSGTPACPVLSAAPNAGIPAIAVGTPGFGTSADVPAVARFHDGRKGQSDQPLFGVKCGERWCILRPQGSDTVHTPHQGQHPTDRRWAVHGWSDSQHLGMMVGSPPHVVRGPIDASVIPGPAADYTAENQFDGVYHHAATVYFDVAPTASEYVNDWGFKKGENQIVIKRNADGTYTGKVLSTGPQCPTGFCEKTVNVFRTDHANVQPPATARFLWEPNDEGAWVRCADGCCKVSAT